MIHLPVLTWELCIHCISPNLKKAREYFDISCKGENALGCNLLGYIYKDSMGVKQNLKLALKYFQLACQLGNNDGCKNQNLLEKKR